MAMNRTTTTTTNTTKNVTKAKTNTPVNTTTNKKTDTVVNRTVSTQQIAERAYGIYLSGKGGSQVDHWLQAERELTKEIKR